jgi:hypothetical protein
MAYAYYRAFTVDHTKLGSTDLSNFPVLVAGTYSWLATTANGGRLTSASGYDFVFAQDAAGTQLLSFERVSYVATSGKIECWVKLPALSHTSDTTFYVLYGDSSVTTDQSTPTSVWSNSFNGVWHLGDGTTLTATDSTSNGYHGTITGVSATAGQISGGVSMNGSQPNGITMGNVIAPGTGDFTLSAWIKFTTAQYAPFIGKRDPNSTQRFALAAGYVDSSGNGSVATTVCLTLYDGSFRQGIHTSATYGDGAWHYVVGTRTAQTLVLYVDGVSQSLVVDQLDATTINVNNAGTFFLGNDGTRTYNGSVDEGRVALGVVRSADWIVSEYNNQANPATFYSLGAEQTPGGGSTPSLRLFALLGCGS